MIVPFIFVTSLECGWNLRGNVIDEQSHGGRILQNSSFHNECEAPAWEAGFVAGLVQQYAHNQQYHHAHRHNTDIYHPVRTNSR
ncbi:hypothetical protein FOT81_24600 [Raoultella planticola]|nr:hypothetical protein [Raoultella planticola]PNK80477.1 hypothetical protein CEP62_021525 [Raoultella planticola]QEU41665.1 hypothetical protein F3X94_10210 [Raoultella planticola]RNN90955.1 hypothetical protein BL127_00026280 [Raoultella planticola]